MSSLDYKIDYIIMWYTLVVYYTVMYNILYYTVLVYFTSLVNYTVSSISVLVYLTLLVYSTVLVYCIDRSISIIYWLFEVFFFENFPIFCIFLYFNRFFKYKFLKLHKFASLKLCTLLFDRQIQFLWKVYTFLVKKVIKNLTRKCYFWCLMCAFISEKWLKFLNFCMKFKNSNFNQYQSVMIYA